MVKNQSAVKGIVLSLLVGALSVGFASHVRADKSVSREEAEQAAADLKKRCEDEADVVKKIQSWVMKQDFGVSCNFVDWGKKFLCDQIDSLEENRRFIAKIFDTRNASARIKKINTEEALQKYAEKLEKNPNLRLYYPESESIGEMGALWLLSLIVYPFEWLLRSRPYRLSFLSLKFVCPSSLDKSTNLRLRKEIQERFDEIKNPIKLKDIEEALTLMRQASSKSDDVQEYEQAFKACVQKFDKERCKVYIKSFQLRRKVIGGMYVSEPFIIQL